MNVEDLMTTAVETCRPGDTLNRPAQIMWERDCGAIPVVDDDGRPIAMITDRDICIAAYTTGRPLGSVPVSLAMSRRIVVCAQHEPVAMAESIRRSQQIRRLPIVDREGKLVGLLSLNDIATHAKKPRKAGLLADGLGPDAIASTLAAICSRSPAGQA